MQVFQGGLVLSFLVTDEVQEVVNAPSHVQAEGAVRDDCQVLPHAKLLGREDALDGAKEEAVMFNLWQQ